MVNVCIYLEKKLPHDYIMDMQGVFASFQTCNQGNGVGIELGSCDRDKEG